MGNLKLEATATDISGLKVDERVLEDRIIVFINNADMPIDMPDEGTWHIARNPKTGRFEITVETGFAQIRYDNPDKETRIDAAAARNIDITEVVGETGIGIITSDHGDVTLTAPGNLIDVTDDKNDVNISAMGDNTNDEGDVTLNVANGAVGDDENRFHINANGTVYVTDKDDIFVDSDENLTMVVNTSEGEVYVTGAKDVDLTNVTGVANIVELLAGNNVNVKSLEDSINIENFSAGGTTSMNANGDIDVEKTTGGFKVDTIVATGNIKLNLDNSLTDIHDDKIKELEDAQREKDEAEAKVDELEKKIAVDTQYQQNLENAITDTQQAIANAEVSDADVRDAKDTLETDKQKVQQIEDLKAIIADPNKTDAEKADAQDQIDTLSATLLTDEQKAELQEKIDKMDKQIKDIVKDIKDKLEQHDIEELKGAETLADIERILNDEKDKIIAELEDLDKELNGDIATGTQGAKKDLEDAKANLEQKVIELANEHVAISAGGNINATLVNGGYVGSVDNSVSMTTGDDGEITISAGEGKVLTNVSVETVGDANLNPFKVNGDARVDATGDIKDVDTTGKTFISADDATLNSVNGTVGTKENPLKLDVNTLTAQGSEVAVNNDKDLEVISVIGKKDPADPESGNVTLVANGDITAGDNNGSNIIGTNVELAATGDVGNNGNPIKIDSDLLGTTSKGLDMESGKDIKISHITATGDVNVRTPGQITAKDGRTTITGHNINLETGGNIGEDDLPLNIISTGDVKAESKTGHAAMRITYIRPRRSVQEVIDDSDDDDYNEEDSYVYPRIAAKIVIKDNKVAKAARAMLKGDEEDTEEDVSKPSDNKKVEDGKKGENVEPTYGQNDDPEIDNNLIMYLAIMLAILLLIIIISGGIILNSKRKEQQAAE